MSELWEGGGGGRGSGGSGLYYGDLIRTGGL